MTTIRPCRGAQRAVLVGTLAVALGATVTPVVAAPAGAPARFVVTLSDGTSAGQVAEARAQVRAAGGRILHDYDSALLGFAAQIPTSGLATLRANPHVTAVERDQPVFLLGRQNDAPPALDRLDQAGRALDGVFDVVATGAGVTAYVIDTGIRATHREFGGRVRPGYSAFPGDGDRDGTSDCHGHGTHVAGSIGGATYGVAKRVGLVPVRVLGCDGSAYASQVIAGIDWVTANHRGPSVANMSIGVVASRALDAAVRSSIASGVSYVVAAGNESDDACDYSPARVAGAITVGAVTGGDRVASFSNRGRCVDLFAPGVDVRSADGASDTGTTTRTGTSMSTPLTAGVVALYLQNRPDAAPRTVSTVLAGTAAGDRLRNLGAGSPDRLLQADVPVGNQKPEVERVNVRLAEGGRIGKKEVPVRVSWSAGDPDGDRIKAYRLQLSHNGGKSWRTVPPGSATDRHVKLDVRPDGDLRFRVRATDALGAKSSNRRTAKLDLTLRQQGAADRTSGWRRDGGKGFSGRSEHVASRRHAGMSFTFRGDHLVIVGSEGRDRGRAKVYVDGRKRGTIDAYRKGDKTRRVLFSEKVGGGKHKVRIVLTGKSRKKARADRVAVDAFVTLG